MVKKYRKKPVVIEAIEWTGNNLKEVIEFTGWHESAKRRWTWNEYEDFVKAHGLKIFTLKGSHMATIGDMIIKGVQGEFYSCKPDIFEETYETLTCEYCHGTMILCSGADQCDYDGSECNVNDNCGEYIPSVCKHCNQ
jgi:hypothetical protein